MYRLKIFIAAILFATSCSVIHAQSAPASQPAQALTIHQKALELLEAMGTRTVLEQNIDAMIENGRQKLVQQHPGLDPAFSEEWTKRMHARVKIDEFLDVVAAIYERHFTMPELDELTQMYHSLAEMKTPHVSAPLKQKLNDELPEVQADMGAGLMQLSEKLGSEVAQSVAADHPEYMKEPPPPAEEQPK
jgi:hypothetical protein